MTPIPGHEPIDDDEVIYRRIPVSTGWYSGDGLSPEAFDPRKDDITGLSVSRGKYKSIAAAGAGMSKKGYYVASLSAADLKAHGIIIEPRPMDDDPGHAELIQLNSGRDPDALLELKATLADLAFRTEIAGPFLPDVQ